MGWGDGEGQHRLMHRAQKLPGQWHGVTLFSKTFSVLLEVEPRVFVISHLLRMTGGQKQINPGVALCSLP